MSFNDLWRQIMGSEDVPDEGSPEREPPPLDEETPPDEEPNAPPAPPSPSAPPSGGPNDKKPSAGLTPGALPFIDNSALRWAELELRKAYQAYLDSKLKSVDEPTVANNAEYQRALIAVQQAKQSYDNQKLSIDTAIDIWKQRGNLALQNSVASGVYTPPEEEPYMPKGVPPYSSNYTNQQSDKLRAMWDWGRRMMGDPNWPNHVSRDDWVNKWGDEGGQLYDFAKYHGMNPANTSADDFINAFPSPGPGHSPIPTPSDQQQVQDMWKWGQEMMGDPNWPNHVSRKDWTDRWGDRGGELYDFAKSHGMNPANSSAQDFYGAFTTMGGGFKAGDTDTTLTPGIKRSIPPGPVGVEDMPGADQGGHMYYSNELQNLGSARGDPYGGGMSRGGPAARRGTGSPYGAPDSQRMDAVGSGGAGGGVSYSSPGSSYVDPSYRTGGAISTNNPQNPREVYRPDFLQTYGNLTGYLPNSGAETAAERQARFNRGLSEGNITGMYNNEETAAERQARFGRGISEGNVTGYYNNAPTQSMQGQLFGQGIQAGNLTGVYNNEATLGGRAQTLAEQQAQNNWNYQRAMERANPSNYALVQALGGQAPWQGGQPAGSSQRFTQQPYVTRGGLPQASQAGPESLQTTWQSGAQGNPYGGQSTRGFGEAGMSTSFPDISARNVGFQAYDRMRPDQRAAFGSAITASGQTPEDWQQQLLQYRPHQSNYQMGSF